MARRLVRLHKTGMLHLVVTPQAFNSGWLGSVEQPGDLQMLLRDFCDAVFPKASSASAEYDHPRHTIDR
jgi:hypothetical protein